MGMDMDYNENSHLQFNLAQECATMTTLRLIDMGPWDMGIEVHKS